MKTSDRVQQLLKLPVNQAPAPAVQLVQFLCKKYGTCGEIYVAAYEAYAIVCEQTEGGMCDEESRRFLTAIKTDAEQSQSDVKAAEMECARTAPGMRSDATDRMLDLQDQIRDGSLTLADALKEINGEPIERTRRTTYLVEKIRVRMIQEQKNSNSWRRGQLAIAEAVLREVAEWLRSEYPQRQGYGTAWANLLDNEANR
jgi:hypothetical protein